MGSWPSRSGACATTSARAPLAPRNHSPLTNSARLAELLSPLVAPHTCSDERRACIGRAGGRAQKAGGGLHQLSKAIFRRSHGLGLGLGLGLGRGLSEAYGAQGSVSDAATR